MKEKDTNMKINEYLPLRDIVFQTIRKAILNGELEPGERLMETQLGEKLGVSRTPIREAIRKLELEGLVVMVARKGAQVAQFTEKDIEDVLQVRASLEALAAKLACKHMDERSFLKLQLIITEYEYAAKED
ncbi:MAG: GntR family transcriptional regulator, partial [Niameybacter sp.]